MKKTLTVVTFLDWFHTLYLSDYMKGPSSVTRFSRIV